MLIGCYVQSCLAKGRTVKSVFKKLFFVKLQKLCLKTKKDHEAEQFRPGIFLKNCRLLYGRRHMCLTLTDFQTQQTDI